MEMSVGANTVTEFANNMGFGHMDQDTLLTQRTMRTRGPHHQQGRA